MVFTRVLEECMTEGRFALEAGRSLQAGRSLRAVRSLVTETLLNLVLHTTLLMVFSIQNTNYELKY
jgi:hypothetical protein